MGRVGPYPYNEVDNIALRWIARSTRCTMSHDVVNPVTKFTPMIEFGIVVDTTKPNSIITETWRKCCLRLIFRKSASCRFFFGAPDLSVLAAGGRRSWPFSTLLVMGVGATVTARRVPK